MGEGYLRILVLGASGMLGSATMRVLSASGVHEVYGSFRSAGGVRHFSSLPAERLITGVDVENTDGLLQLFHRVKPDAVINCIGLIKQLAQADDPLVVLPINSLLPHRLARLCGFAGARLVHVSTDCVFSGSNGFYTEQDFPDAGDLYGRSKLLGEVDYPHAITLRTSIIGEELESSHGLVGWFLSQHQKVRGYTRAFFSGLPTFELARVIDEFVLPKPELHGLYHVAAAPIAKYDLLQLVNSSYGKGIDIEPNDALVIDRSLNGSRFAAATGYQAASWPELIDRMRDFHMEKH
ncbi:dTDP-4-dehydrorhamnose reductase family protein [Hoeflea sp.]|uniref:dTDP-4-dehydrorhamnose reductase family protein n=1 Tax=Hoeflea sp. TaxID=1940281 RepID=UPI003A8D80C0